MKRALPDGFLIPLLFSRSSAICNVKKPNLIVRSGQMLVLTHFSVMTQFYFQTDSRNISRNLNYWPLAKNTDSAMWMLIFSCYCTISMFCLIRKKCLMPFWKLYWYSIPVSLEVTEVLNGIWINAKVCSRTLQRCERTVNHLDSQKQFPHSPCQSASLLWIDNLNNASTWLHILGMWCF